MMCDELLQDLLIINEPSEKIIQTFQATLLLLSEPKDEIQNWQNIQEYFTIIGKKNIIKKINNFKLFETAESLINEVKGIMNDIRDDEIYGKNIPTAPASFFLWTKINLQTYDKLCEKS